MNNNIFESLLRKTFVLLSILQLTVVKSATCISLASGQWANAATWSCGHIPTCGDSVIISATHAITVTGVQDLRGCGSNLVIVVRGILRYATSGRLRLACNSRVYIFAGASLVPLGDGGGSNELEICGVRQWRASDGTINGAVCFPATITACAAVLPVELIIFKELENCDQKEDKVCLMWETVSERNNDFFSVEKSANGLDFMAVGNLKSQALNGNSTSKLSYAFNDKKSNEDPVYYRLKQVDFDERFSYSDIIITNTNSRVKKHFSVFPNPSDGNFTINAVGIKYGRITKVVLKDITATIVYDQYFYLENNQSSIEVNLQKTLPLGYYTCYLYINSIEYKTKLIIR